MGTHSICFYKGVAKQYTRCNPKSTELLDCALIGVCAIIRSNTICLLLLHENVFLVPVLHYMVNIQKFKHIISYCFGLCFVSDAFVSQNSSRVANSADPNQTAASV